VPVCVRVSGLSVCVCVCTLRRKWLEQSTPKLIQTYSMVAVSLAKKMWSKGQRLHDYQKGHGCTLLVKCAAAAAAMGCTSIGLHMFLVRNVFCLFAMCFKVCWTYDRIKNVLFQG